MDYYIHKLSSKESIGIELLSVNAELPAIASARCEQCTAIQIPLSPQEVHAKWKLRFGLWLMVTGLAINVYFLVALLQLLAYTSPDHPFLVL